MILGTVITFSVGCACIVFGILNMLGNISSIHEYHRYRVSERDVIPFGRLVGLGTVIIGACIILFSILMLISSLLSLNYLLIVGAVILFFGLVIGTAITFYAMKKYNGGIF